MKYKKYSALSGKASVRDRSPEDFCKKIKKNNKNELTFGQLELFLVM